MKLNELVDTITNKADLVAFIEALAVDLNEKPDQWENRTLGEYLGALASWLEDSEGSYRHRNLTPPSTPSWKNVGEMLLAAKFYE